jgi:hypothetical protein
MSVSSLDGIETSLDNTDVEILVLASGMVNASGGVLILDEDVAWVLLRGVIPGEEEESVCLLFTRDGMDRFLVGWAGAGLARGLTAGLLRGLLQSIR